MLRSVRRRLSILLVLICSLAQVAIVPVEAASDGWQRAPGTTTTFYASDQEVQTYIAPPSETQVRAQSLSFIARYQDLPPAAVASFQHAAQIWESLLVMRVPITVAVSWEPLGAGVIGAAGPSDFFRDSSTPWLPVALAQQYAGEDLNPGEPDIIAVFNSTDVNWYFGTGQAPPGQINFATAVLHELAHGLGFIASLDVRAGQGGWGVSGAPFAYDLFVVDGVGTNLLDTWRYPMPSTALAAALQSNQLFFTGPDTRGANNGQPAHLHAPNPFVFGSSVSHLDEGTYPPGSPNSLMTAFGSPGETIYHPGPLALGMLSDLGWLLAAPLPPPAPPPPSTPPPVPPAPSPSAPAGGTPSCFNETGKCVPPLFMTFWETHGGLAINGLPLTDARLERLEDGKEYYVQWFERVRMEHHPGNAPPNNILLGQFGRLIHPADPPVAQAAGQAYFPETGHNVPPDFMAFWTANGGLPQFGFPLSEVFTETLEDGKRYQVQYFERARFERHPENNPPNHIQLGQFGRRILEGGAQPSPSPTPAPSPSASPSPSANVLFQDNFTDPNSGWPIGKHPQGHYESHYLPGEFRIALAAADYYAILTNRNFAPQANVRLEADMTRFGPVQEPLFGFACRSANLDNFYGAVIDTFGNALLFKFQDGRYVELGRAQNHPAIQRGNATNRVRFDCVGTQLTLYVNGTPITTAQDGAFGGGQQGFLVFSFEQGGLDLHIRNFIAYRP